MVQALMTETSLYFTSQRQKPSQLHDFTVICVLLAWPSPPANSLKKSAIFSAMFVQQLRKDNGDELVTA